MTPFCALYRQECSTPLSFEDPMLRVEESLKEDAARNDRANKSDPKGYSSSRGSEKELC